MVFSKKIYEESGAANLRLIIKTEINWYFSYKSRKIFFFHIETLQIPRTHTNQRRFYMDQGNY